MSGTHDESERARRLITAAVDGEIDPREREELERIAREDPSVRAEWERMARVKEVTETMTLKRPPEEVWDRYWVAVYNKAERGIAWILVSIGAVVILSWGLWHALRALLVAEGLPGFVKAAILAVTVGGVWLLVSVVREQWFTRRRDPYKEVRR